MYRVTMMSGKFYGFKFEDFEDEDELENIKTFVDEGTPVILTDDIEDLEDRLGIDIEVVS